MTQDEETRAALRELADSKRASAVDWREMSRQVRSPVLRDALSAFADVTETLAHAVDEAADDLTAEPLTDLGDTVSEWLLDRQAFRPVEVPLDHEIARFNDEGCPHHEED